MKREAMDYRDKIDKAFSDVRPAGAWPLRNLLAVQVPKPKHGDRWGDWVLDFKRLCLCYIDPNPLSHWWYEVDLERETLQIWLENFAGKARDLRGGDARSLGDLADALMALKRHHLFPACRAGRGSGVKSLSVRT